MGWREWVALPDLGVANVKAKIDTGARGCALHASDVQIFRRDGVEHVRFTVHPFQRDSQTTIQTESPLLEQRWVRSSSGHETLRPAIRTCVRLCGAEHDIEITLVNRDSMGFRMLLGRTALRGRYLVDPGRSFLGGRPPPGARKASA